MQVQDVVIEQTFHDVEQTPAGDHRGNQRCPLAVHIRSTAATPQPEHTHQNGKPRSGVKHSIRDQIGSQTDVRTGGQQVVPTQQLVQDDSVHKCAKTDAKEQSGTKDVGTDGCIHAYRHTRTVPPIPGQSDTPQAFTDDYWVR